MNPTVPIERFTRQNQSLTGALKPAELPRLSDFLAGPEGEIAYELQGSQTIDPMGRQNRRLKCIISGWFLLIDGTSLQGFRYPLAIESRLVVVRSEADLPPLEAEADDEDYIVCPAEMDVVERVEEEILLNLPSQAVRNDSAVAAKRSAPGQQGEATGTKAASPFAKLAELKKSR